METMGWMINWLCMIMLFSGLVILGRNLDAEIARSVAMDAVAQQHHVELKAAIHQIDDKLDMISLPYQGFLAPRSSYVRP